MRLCYHYPNNGLTEKGMAVIAEDWFTDFRHAGISPELFSRVVILARRRCKFFPVESELLGMAQEIWAMDQQRAAVVPALTEPDTMSDEQAERNLRRLRKMIELVGSGKSSSDAEREMAEFIESGR